MGAGSITQSRRCAGTLAQAEATATCHAGAVAKDDSCRVGSKRERTAASQMTRRTAGMPFLLARCARTVRPVPIQGVWRTGLQRSFR